LKKTFCLPDNSKVKEYGRQEKVKDAPQLRGSSQYARYFGKDVAQWNTPEFRTFGATFGYGLGYRP
jgi:hypothetical protein